MADPRLFDMMNGVYPKKKTMPDDRSPSARPPAANDGDSDAMALEELIKEEVESLMSAEDPSAKLLPAEARRAKIEQEVRAAADYSKLGKFISTAFEILRKEGSAYLDKKEDESLQQSLDKFTERLEDLHIKELTDEKMAAALALPPEILKLILKVAIEKFRQGQIADSLAIFVFLTTVDEEEPDFWFRLGLVAQNFGNDELALQALTTTSRLAPDFIGAYLYAAESYFKTGRRGDAESELKKAKALMGTSQRDEWQDRISEIEQLLAA